ncbi:MAG: glycosyltransferase family 2 protein [Candidatus Omnitrophica bacterium]|nr:glycosyltransferase family 2 protein [Candidatus Omnitrophota bacterium]
MNSSDSPVLSLVIPCYNEENNLPPLIAAIDETIKPMGLSFEVIIVDDRSTDSSWQVLKNLAAAHPELRALRLEANSGESAATWAGLKIARGKYLVTLDADLQNDPHDLPRLMPALEHCDCVCGTRVATRHQGDSRLRILSSRIANGIRNALSGENISDAGCTYRVFRRECIANLKFFHGMHRFMPTLIKMEGFSVTEVPVTAHPRYSGQSHYGVWNRLFASFHDLLAVRWMKKRMFRFRVAEQVNVPRSPEDP